MPGFLYDPNSNYGYKPIAGPWAGAKSWMDTYAGNQDIELNPESWFTHVLAGQGLGGLDQQGQIARNLYGRTLDDYGAARLKNNQLTFKDFMTGVDFNKLIAGMFPGQRGENQSNYAPMDVRWLQR